MKSEDWTQSSGLGLRSWASLCSPRLLWRGRSQQARRRLMAGTAEGSRHPIKNGLSAGAHKRAERAGPCEPLAAAKRILLVFLFPPSPSDPSSSFGFGALSSFFSTLSPVLPRASNRLRCVSAASCSHWKQPGPSPQDQNSALRNHHCKGTDGLGEAPPAPLCAAPAPSATLPPLGRGGHARKYLCAPGGAGTQTDAKAGLAIFSFPCSSGKATATIWSVFLPCQRHI